MREEKFKIIQFIRELILIIDKELDNFPKKDIELKNRIRNASYNILELAYKANVITNINKKKEYLEDLFAEIKILDFLLNLCYDKMIITQKKYYKFGEKINDIIKYSTGWLNSLNNINQGTVDWLASANTSNNNNLYYVNTDGNINNNNNNTNGLRPVASIHCGYAINDCIRDNIETNRCPLVKQMHGICI